MTPNRDSAPAKYVPPEDYFSGRREPGEFTIKSGPDGDTLYATVPGGAGACCPLQPSHAKGWVRLGDVERLTLHPSVLVHGYRGQQRFERWHGWLRNGVWVSC